MSDGHSGGWWKLACFCKLLAFGVLDTGIYPILITQLCFSIPKFWDGQGRKFTNICQSVIVGEIMTTLALLTFLWLVDIHMAHWKTKYTSLLMVLVSFHIEWTRHMKKIFGSDMKPTFRIKLCTSSANHIILKMKLFWTGYWKLRINADIDELTHNKKLLMRIQLEWRILIGWHLM